MNVNHLKTIGPGLLLKGKVIKFSKMIDMGNICTCLHALLLRIFLGFPPERENRVADAFYFNMVVI